MRFQDYPACFRTSKILLRCYHVGFPFFVETIVQVNCFLCFGSAKIVSILTPTLSDIFNVPNCENILFSHFEAGNDTQGVHQNICLRLLRQHTPDGTQNIIRLTVEGVWEKLVPKFGIEHYGMNRSISFINRLINGIDR